MYSKNTQKNSFLALFWNISERCFFIYNWSDPGHPNCNAAIYMLFKYVTRYVLKKYSKSNPDYVENLVFGYHKLIVQMGNPDHIWLYIFDMTNGIIDVLMMTE